jgi:branched-chain amino acid transport system permease protein
VPQLLKHKSLEHWTGGVQGLFLSKPEPPAWLPLDVDQYMYLLALGGGGLLRPGAQPGHQPDRPRLMATRDHPTAAEAMGMDIARSRPAPSPSRP